MSYNGVGLQTARGSGTNGFVQANRSFVHKRTHERREDSAAVRQSLNKEIASHDAKRKIEVQLLEMRDQMEEEGLDEDDIEERIAQLRPKLSVRQPVAKEVANVRKEWENARFADAVGLKNKRLPIIEKRKD